MSEFKVKISGMDQRAAEEQRIAGTLNSLESQIRSVKRALSGSVGNRESLGHSLGLLADRVNRHEQDLKTMRSVLVNVKNNYEKTERRICGYANDHPITIDDIWNAVTTVGKGLAINAMFPGGGLAWLTGTILKDEEWSGKSEWLKMDYKDRELKKILEKKKKSLSDEKWEYDKDKGEWVKKEEKKDEKKKTKEEEKKLNRKALMESINIWSGSLSKEGSLLHLGKDGDVETEWGNYTYSADIMKAEATASGHADLGGFGGEVGVALTAFTAGAGVQLGSDMLGAHAEGQVDVLKAEASVGGEFGVWDENGDFNPQVGVSAKMEAIAAEVSGKVGVDIAGTEINAKGSLNFGIGAHADIGFNDGKFKFDVGASLGVGGSVSLEVDVSGTVDKVVEHAQDIGNAVVDAYDTTMGYLSDAANAVGEGFKSGLSAFTGLFK
ncbi:MAG: hypothetical protein NC121_04780 [Blautia sp.]|nr:hypothetical protein [Blautia sp.]